MQAAGALAAAGMLRNALAETGSGYPDRPVSLVVPFPPGSVTDIVARVVAKALQEDMGAPFVVENRPGGQTTIGTSQVARSKPDGHTLLVAALSFVSAPNEVRNVPYDPVADFEPVALLGTFPIVLMVREEFPADTIEGFLAHARKLGRPLAGGYGSSSTRVAATRLRQLGGIAVTEVPYKGIPNAVTDLMGGVIDFTFVDLGNALTYAKGGRVKSLGVTSAQPSPRAPELPALSAVLPDFEEISAWLAVLAPAGTDPAVIDRLHRAIDAALVQPETEAALAAAAMAPPTVDLPALRPFVQAEVKKWAALFSVAGIEPQ